MTEAPGPCYSSIRHSLWWNSAQPWSILIFSSGWNYMKNSNSDDYVEIVFKTHTKYNEVKSESKLVCAPWSHGCENIFAYGQGLWVHNRGHSRIVVVCYFELFNCFFVLFYFFLMKEMRPLGYSSFFPKILSFLPSLPWANSHLEVPSILQVPLRPFHMSLSGSWANMSMSRKTR